MTAADLHIASTTVPIWRYLIAIAITLFLVWLFVRAIENDDSGDWGNGSGIT